jgi:hypothetical protein
LEVFKKADLKRCKTRKDVDAFNDDSYGRKSCDYIEFKTNSGQPELLILHAKTVASFSTAKEVLLAFVLSAESSQVESISDTLSYYQEMLLDGRANYIHRRGYQSLRTEYKPKSIYDTTIVNEYSRDLESDIKAFKTTNSVFDSVTLWQTILTAVELSSMRQIVEFVKTEQINLGPAGSEATSILEAMIVCQIQSLCYLERHQLAALGFHNYFDEQ